MPLWLRPACLWCRDRCPWDASACGRLPRTGFLEPLRARQCGRRQRPALSCSHQRKPSVTPAGDSLHTSPLPFRCWCGRGLAARPPEGMGQMCFPLVRPRTPWGRASVTFSSRRLSKSPLRPPASPVRTAAAPRTSFPRVTVSSGRLAQLCFRQAVLPRLAPGAGIQTCHLPHPGDPGRSDTAGGVPSFKVGPRGVGGGSHRLAGPVASNSALEPASARMYASSCTTHAPNQMTAAGRGAVHHLVHPTKAFSAAGPVVSETRAARW